MPSRLEDCNPDEREYIEVYKRELAGLGRVLSSTVLRKHAGLGIIAFFSDEKNGWRLNIIGRKLLDGLAKSSQPQVFSRYQFLIATHIQSGARMLIDLGSANGNLLVAAGRTMETEEFRSMYHAGMKAMQAAAEHSRKDSIHSELNDYYSAHELESMSQLIKKSVDLPTPAYWTGNVFLRSDHEHFSWLPLTGPMLIYIEDHLFGLDPNKLDSGHFLEYFGHCKIWSYLNCVSYKGISSSDAEVERKPTKFWQRFFICCQNTKSKHKEEPSNDYSSKFVR